MQISVLEDISINKNRRGYRPRYWMQIGFRFMYIFLTVHLGVIYNRQAYMHLYLLFGLIDSNLRNSEQDLKPCVWETICEYATACINAFSYDC